MANLLKCSLTRLCLALSVMALLAGCSSREDRARAYYKHGVELLAANDQTRAAIEFLNAVKLDKNMIVAWRALAKIDEGNRNWERLLPALRSIVSLDPKDIDAKIKLARLLSLSGSIDEALTLVNAANEQDGHNAETLAMKALLLFKLNDAAGATRDARAALAIDPGNGGALLVLAAERLAAGDSKAALKILDSDSVATAKDLGIQLFRLKVFEQVKDFQQAENLLRKLIELYPEEPAFRRQLIRLYVDQHRPEDAEKEQRAICSAHPNDPQAVLDLVKLVYTLKGPDAARQELVSRINAGGKVFPYRLALVDLDVAQGKRDDAVKSLESFISGDDSPEHVVQAKTKLAEIYLNGRQIEAADKIVGEVLRKDAGNTLALKLHATILLERGQVEPAINALRQALNDQPRAADLMLMLAGSYERVGSMELAEKQFAEAMRASNFDPRVGLTYAAFLQRHGNMGRAEDVLTELANRSPRNIEVLSTLAQVRLQRQNWVGAQELAETIRKLGDNRGIADQISGGALSGENKYEESIRAFENAYAAAPASVQPMVALVRAYVGAKKTDRAEAFLQSVLKANPANAEALVLLGSVQLGSNAPDQAQKSFVTAIEKQPDNIIGYQALAEFYIGQTKYDEALNTLRAGLEKQPDNASLRLVQAGLLERKGDVEGAVAQYEHMLKQDPSSLVAANNLASLLADYRTDKASLERAQSLAAGLQKSPVPQFKDTLGWINYLRGDYKSALPLLEDASAAMPDRAMVQYHLGMTYLANGVTEKASQKLNMALSRNPDSKLKEKIETELKKLGS